MGLKMISLLLENTSCVLGLIPQVGGSTAETDSELNQGCVGNRGVSSNNHPPVEAFKIDRGD